MPSENDALWADTAKLLRRRPGWHVQAMSTPGALAYWNFAAGTARELAVTVEDNAINVHAASGDLAALGSASELAQWLAANWPGSLQEPSGGFLEKLKSRKLFRW